MNKNRIRNGEFANGKKTIQGVIALNSLFSRKRNVLSSIINAS